MWDGLTHPPAQLGDGGFHVNGLKQTCAGHKSIRAGAGTIGTGLVVDAAVHADAVGQILFTSPSRCLLNLGQAFADEFLSAETGIDRHHQQEINLVEKWLSSGNCRGRIDGKANFLAKRFYFLDERRNLVTEFDVNDHFIRPGFGKGFKQDFRPGTHEVNVEKQFGERADGFDDLRTEGNVWHEVTIHDVEMQPISTGSLRAFGPLTEASMVRGEQRWGNDYFHNFI